jgi:hypothetical protein
MSTPFSHRFDQLAVNTMKTCIEFRGWLRPACTVALALLAMSTASGPLHAQANSNPPERMTYQGFLVDGNGLALGNTAPRNYDIIFKIFNHETQSGGANLLWAEQQTVTVDKGYFSVLLGEGASTGDPRPALSTLFTGPTASDRYVGVTVKGIGANNSNVDILPRLRLLTSPYAYLAGQAIKVVRTDNGADLLTSSGNAITVNGSFTAASFTGIGSGLTQINANNISSGVLNADRIPNLNASKITAGTISDALLSANIARRNTGNTFTGEQWIDGHLRVGVNSVAGSSGYGTAMILSGAPGGENTDPLWLARFNNGVNASELRVNIGDDPGSSADRLVVGTTLGGGFNQTGTWTPYFALTARGELEFRPGLAGKQPDAGKIGYQLFDDALDFVGAGTSGSNRKISMWAEGGLTLYGHIANGLNVDNGWGRTFDVPSDYIRVYNATDKAKNFIMFRYGGGVGIRGFGGGWGNASGWWERTITWDGDGNWDASSDRKMKKDIVDAEPMLDRALKVQIRRFRWKQESDDAKLSWGVIAQELEPLFPEMVSVQEGPAGDGPNESNLAVGYSDFGMVAIKALQELKALQDSKLNAVEAELTSVKEQVADLKAQIQEVLQANADLRNRLDKAKTTAAVDR